MAGAASPSASSSILLRIFHSFATFGDRLADGSSMDNSRFAKLTRDTGSALGEGAGGATGAVAVRAPWMPRRGLCRRAEELAHALSHHRHAPPPTSAVLDSLLTPTDVDIIFARVKPRTERKIRFPEFKRALDEMARVKVRHDPRAAVVFARCGPSPTPPRPPPTPQFGADPNGPARLRERIVSAGGPLLDAVHLPSVGGVFDKLTSPSSYTGSSRERFAEDGRGRGKEGRVDVGVAPPDFADQLRPEQHLGGTRLSSAHAERVRLVDGGSLSPSRMGYLSGGPPSPTAAASATAAAAAVAAASAAARASESDGGSPARGYSGKAATLQAILTAMPSFSEAQGAKPTPAEARAAAISASRSGPRVVIESPELRAVFAAYAAFGTTNRLVDELDSGRFAKLCRESGVCDGTRVTPAAVDLAFTLAKKQGARAINYSDFQQALASLAPTAHPDLEMVPALQTVVECIIAAGGPAVTGVSVPDVAPASVFAKLTDTSLYTGASKLRFDRQGNGKGLEGRIGDS